MDRYCDLFRAIRVSRHSAKPGSTLERVGRAHCASSERAATAAKSNWVLLTIGDAVAFQTSAPLYVPSASTTEKTQPIEEAGELPSFKDPGVQASAPTGGSLG